MADGVLDFILEGLERALELERELGVRAVPCDRALLVPEGAPPSPPSPTPPTPPKPTAERREAARLVFLHDRPLSPGGVEMMAKILEALHLTLAEAPIVVAPPLPSARIAVVLGGLALRKYFPDVKAGPGQWVELPDGRLVLVTYSPEYILRFKAVTSDVRTIKLGMWQSLKAAAQRLRA